MGPICKQEEEESLNFEHNKVHIEVSAREEKGILLVLQDKQISFCQPCMYMYVCDHIKVHFRADGLMMHWILTMLAYEVNCRDKSRKSECKGSN
jgi:hypothetical protein